MCELWLLHDLQPTVSTIVNTTSRSLTFIHAKYNMASYLTTIFLNHNDLSLLNPYLIAMVILPC